MKFKNTTIKLMKYFLKYFNTFCDSRDSNTQKSMDTILTIIYNDIKLSNIYVEAACKESFVDPIIKEIRDLDIFQDSLLYITTDKGIFVGNYNNNLKSADNWTQQFYGDTARQFVNANYPFVITGSSILQKQGDNWVDYYVGLTGNFGERHSQHLNNLLVKKNTQDSKNTYVVAIML